MKLCTLSADFLDGNHKTKSKFLGGLKNNFSFYMPVISIYAHKFSIQVVQIGSATYQKRKIMSHYLFCTAYVLANKRKRKMG